MARSKRYQEAVKKVEKNKSYSVEEAIKLVKTTATTKFDSSVEVHLRLGIDPKKGEQQVRGTVSLPHGTGKTKRIAAFVAPDREKEAQAAGADVVGGQELIDQIKQTGKLEFDVAVTMPEMMPKLAAVAKVLGPRGLMPSPKNETITTNLKKTIEELKKGKVNFKNDGTGNIHQMIGKVSFTDSQLLENYQALLDTIRKAKPSSSKGVYLKNISLTTSMGPGIRVTLSA
ncbi:MAG: 50S ribosomal protein L1 [Candidatus Buchananbacteria bacterium RIFCSPLOWO2_01_FULL_56_15]|uniref:Large ribosomal subunit protein uL1 n=2 Tax=Candidatus Buchananiibacteriota TaxID=1817903 RepID=A0A1G1YJ45_9BACT|nr:MAG: 50S ribosomal protein L1 [Candidatus Buchananbacteria bacterium RIFCSPHIGHO2_02_FULL_56_16]OGY54575.1 MAG: 50S ribosomal protein L1 [Candidatus Buchananbacteria bacterium RIFCSPLOWO2_01_FULL_56_15]